MSRKINRLKLRLRTAHPRETRLWKVAEQREKDILLLRQVVARCGTGWYKAASSGDAIPHLDEFSQMNTGQLVSLLQRMSGERWSTARKAALVQVATERAYSR